MKKFFSSFAALAASAALTAGSCLGVFAGEANIYEKQEVSENEPQYYIIVQSDSKPLSQYDGAKKNGVDSFIFTEEGQAAFSEVKNEHADELAAINELLGKENGICVEYTAAYSGFTLKLTLSEALLIEDNLTALGLKGIYVSNSCEENTESVLKKSMDSGYSIESKESTYEEMSKWVIEKVGAGGEYKGEGTVVAVIDNAMDLDHEFFSLPEGTEARLGKEDIENVSAYLSAAGGFGSDFYVNEKIPFAFNYSDMTNDTSHGSESHGTHVSGIVAGNGETETDPKYDAQGIAPEAQLLLMANYKLEDYSILASLDDCMYLGADVINESFGATGMMVNNGSYFEEAYKNIHDCGITVCDAAGNEGKASYMNSLDNPDYSTGGVPNAYSSDIAVGSAQNPVSEQSFMYLGEDIFPILNFSNGKGIASENNTDSKFEYVMVPGNGLDSDYEEINVNGKIAVVSVGVYEDGEDPISEIAERHGAVGMLAYIEGSDDLLNASSESLLGATITDTSAKALADSSEKYISFDKKVIMDDSGKSLMSGFSTWDFTETLDLKPDVTGYGGNIISSYPGNKYGSMSGTSMATPQITGVSALLKQYLVKNEEKYGITSDADYPELIAKLLMSTANPIYSSDGLQIASPRVQGSGLINLNNAINTPVYLYTDSERDGFRPKLSLGYDSKKVGVYEFKFYARNISDQTCTYKLDADLFSDGADGDQLDWNIRSLIKNIEFTDSDGVNITELSIAPNADYEINVKVTLTVDDMNYIDDNFKNGTFIDGFIHLNSTDYCQLVLPFTAFFGDWSKADIFEPFIYSGRPYAARWSFMCDNANNVAGFHYIGAESGEYLYDEEATSMPCYSPNGDGVFDSILVEAAFKRRGSNLTVNIYNNKAKDLVVYTKNYGNILRQIDDNSEPMPQELELDWDFKDLDGKIHENEIYTMYLVATVPGTSKRYTVSQEFSIDITAPEIESCFELMENGEKRIIMKAKDGLALQGAVMLDGENGEWSDHYCNQPNDFSQYIVMNIPQGNKFTAEVYDIAGNSTTVTEKDVSASERYTLSYSKEPVYCCSDEPNFSSVVSLIDAKGHKVPITFNVTPSAVYKRGLDGFSVRLGGQDISYIEASVGIRGDADQNGSINIFDAVYVAKYTVGKNSPEYKDFEDSLGYCLSDMNKDKTVNIFDASSIAKYTVSQ